MNWLAHLYLSEPDAEFRIGNLLPDLIRRSELAGLPEPFQKGIRCHRKIDVFTDSHPRVKACVTRFPSPYRRYGGILTDIYFDHFLARDWATYSGTSLPDFLDHFYRQMDPCLPALPAIAEERLRRIRQENWLSSYSTIDGITDILHRVSYRLQRPFDLSGSRTFFAEHQSAFFADFREFFPELIAHVQTTKDRGPALVSGAS